MSDEEKRWPFDGFYLKLAEAQREYEQEQHIDPASLTEEERQQKLQEILDWITASRKKKKEADEQLDLIVPEEEPETAGATPQPAKQYITDLVGEDYKNWHGIVVLDAGTNSGKTYFILKTLLPWAYEHRKRILILCNREALRNQIERDVNRLGSMLMSGRLNQHLAQIDEQAENRMEELIESLNEKYPAPNKETEQMAWVAHQNNLTAMAEEIVLKELVYN